ncbi:L,D-transpeptidase [Kaistia algarum]|nr:L,D-transpeptidase [Kaistia algarum]
MVKGKALTDTKPRIATGKLSRRSFMIGMPIALAGCQTAGQTSSLSTMPAGAPIIDQGFREMYAAIDTEPFPVPAVDLKQIDPQFFRQVVQLPPEIAAQPGTLVVDPPNHFLYLVFENGTAIRYGVGVGRQGFAWSGDATIQAKQQWPKWHPPKEMMARDPEAAKWPTGMPGGPGNPLGARAMYLYQGKVDTLYRIHGTTQPWSIGKSLSSGCIRLINQDIIDLYERVPIGTRVTVLGNVEPDPNAVYNSHGGAVPDPQPARTSSTGTPVPPDGMHG